MSGAGGLPPWSSAAAIAQAVQAGRASAEAVVRDHLDRIAARDAGLHAFLHVCAAEALDRARSLDEARTRGQPLGPLAGVPIGLKDALVTRGIPTTAGSRILDGWIPPYQATVVDRLEAAGAVVIGKCNMDEFAMGSSTESSAYGPTRNPWDRGRVPGGSSGGSAAAVAADLCALSLGTDTGGSIRQPASLSGCVGVRPTYGRVSRHGVVAYASSLDQVGPLARTVADCALLLEVIAGLDPLDATSIDAPVPRYRDACAPAAIASLAGLRVGVPGELFAPGIDPEVERGVRAAIAVLVELGAEVVPVSLPHAPHAIAAYYVVACAEASSNLARYDGVRYGLREDGGGRADLAAMYRATRTAGFGAETRLRILLGTFALRSGYHDELYVRAQRVRALIARDFEEAFARCDVVAGPVSPVPAFRLGERRHDPLEMYLADACTVPSNLAGLPGLSVPCAFTDGDLPVGLQLIAPPLGEAVMLRVAAAFEARSPAGQRRPPVELASG